jgi:hypothetical protein
MRPVALPISQSILLDLVAPPAISFVWALMSGRWAAIVHGGRASDETQQRQRTEFPDALKLAAHVVQILHF